MAKRNRFEIRRRKYDGKYIRWELMGSRTLGLDGDYDGPGEAYDHPVWVVTGVFETRKAAFKR